MGIGLTSAQTDKPPEALLSSLSPVKIDHLFYARKGKVTCFVPERVSHSACFPRRVIVSQGFIFQTTSLGRVHSFTSSWFGSPLAPTHWRENGFRNSGLQSLCVPFTIDTICADSFGAGEGLASVAFEYGSRLRHVNRGALADAPMLRSLCFPASLTDLDWGCFVQNCGLASVMFEPGCGPAVLSRWLFAWSGVLSLCIPSSVRTIKAGCFVRCKLLAFVTFQAGSRLSRIEKQAFHYCQTLESICIPSGVKRIEEEAFAYCRTLSKVTFEDGSQVRRIDSHVFWWCSALQSISLPTGVRTIHRRCFEDCPALVTRDSR
jgi:hypothetical protein